MKILLIDPPFYRFIGYYNRYFPLGLAYIAAVLQEQGHEVLIYDADCNVDPTKMDYAQLEENYPLYIESIRDKDHGIWKEVRSTIEKFRPDVIGITVWTTFAASAFRISSICKEYDSNIPVVMGGPHISIRYEEVLEICRDVDFLIRGEGEETFTDLLKYLQNSKGNGSKKLSDIKGVSYRNDGQHIHNEKREFIADLDSIPMPARDLLINKDTYDSEDMGLLMTSRGCPYDCSYCATNIWERNTRYRSVNNIIVEIEEVIAKYGTKQFTFKDDSFTVNRKRVAEFCNKILEKGIEINWDCNTRANLIDEEMLGLMKKAGCNSIKIGVETGSERISQLMKKNVTFDQYRNAARLLKKIGIHWTGYFMMGLPSETKEEIYSTLEFMKELKPDYASLSVYEPFPGTSLFEFGVEKGLVEPSRSLEDYSSISPKYYYVKDLSRRIDTMTGKEFDEIEDGMKKAFHEYNRGFLRLVSRAGSRSKLYLHDPKVLFSDFRKFLNWI